MRAQVHGNASRPLGRYSLAAAALIWAAAVVVSASADDPKPDAAETGDAVVYPDYAAELNALLDPGVPVNQNAWAVLLPVLAGDDAEDEQVARMAAWLGLAWPPDDSMPAPFVPWSDWSKANLSAEDLEQAENDEVFEFMGVEWPGTEPSRADEWFEAAMDGVWTPEQLPHIERWLAANTETLKATSAVLESRPCFLPVLIDQPFWPDASNTALQYMIDIRAMARTAQIAVNRAAAVEDIDAMVDGLRLLIGLARAGESRPFAINRLVGISIDAIRLSTIRALIEQGEISGRDAEALWRAGVSRHRDGLTVGESIGLGERRLVLSLVDQLHRDGPAMAMDRKAGPVGAALWQRKFLRDRATSKVNAFYDQLVAASGETDALAFDEAWGRAEALLGPCFGLSFDPVLSVSGMRSVIRQFQFWTGVAYANMPPERMTDMLVDQGLWLVSPALRAVWRTERYIVVQARLTETAVALMAYGHVNGRWPDRLDALVPGWLDSLPLDLDGDALRYAVSEDGAGFVLYSIGRDGEDNGGVGTVEFSTEDGTDVVIRVRLDEKK